MISTNPFGIDPKDVHFSEADWSAVDGTRVIEGTPRSASKILYTSPDEKFCTGLYACSAGKWRVSYTENEFCTLLEGSVTMTCENGASQTFTAPASFLIPEGFNGIWEPHGHLLKIFVVYEPGIQK